MKIEAYAKVNLSLRVAARDSSGLHPLRSLVQSIDWADQITLADSDDDEFLVVGGGVPSDGTNLAVRALETLRSVVGRSRGARLELTKAIPVAAGLGGGSADAAAVLAAGADRCRLDPRARDELAPELGADVAFCLRGGTALMEGYGETITPLPTLDDFELAVVVPPSELSTEAVYRRWDELGAPAGPSIDGRDLPDSLREEEPLVNDLVPAAIDLAPELGDWVEDLRRLWGIPVAMSGSGPSLFGLFPPGSEAAEAVGAVTGARAVRACRPIGRGWRVVEK